MGGNGRGRLEPAMDWARLRASQRHWRVRRRRCGREDCGRSFRGSLNERPEMAIAAVEHVSKPTADASERLRILMICAHEPTLDPRIRWEAEGAARDFDVTVLGLKNEGGDPPNAGSPAGYKIVRLRRRDVSSLQYALHLRTIISWPAQLTVASALVLLWPVLFVGEIVFRLVAQIGRLTTVSLPISIVRRWRNQEGTRPTFFNRLEFILASMRGGFSPATTLFWEHLCSMPDKPHVVHCNDLDTLLVGVRAKREFCCRVIYEVHEFWLVDDGLWI